MSRQGHPEDHVKRIVLPSGKTIEVVCFGNPGAEEATVISPDVIAEAAPPAPVRVPEEALHICPECNSHLVHPCEWDEVGKDIWEVSRRCPNCEWHEIGVFAQDLLEDFDEELDRGIEELHADLKRLVRANMAEEMDRFIAALAADAIHPMDF